MESDGESITNMTESAVDIIYKVFFRNCNDVFGWAFARGYGFMKPSLTLKHDWHVSYHKSTFQGQPCFYLVWSAIEFIWLEQPSIGTYGYGDMGLRR